MNPHHASLVTASALVLLCCSHTAPAIAASTTSQPAAPDPDARRLTFIGDQLSADEAAIAAIDKALFQAGYQAAVAAHHANDAARGNELMDRNGGAPIPWKDFYGRTAKDFIMHDKGSPVYHQVARPSQMDYVYRANDNQIASAKAEVDAMGKKVGLLLARRKQLEAEQSSLWATLAFESITNRDIALRGLYRDQLKAGPAKENDNRPDGARTTALAAAVLYMRTIDHTITALSDKIETDQFSVYAALRDTLAPAQNTLKEAAAVFADTPGADPAEVRQMMDVVNEAKRVQSLCKDACDAYKKAQDADAAQEEGRKLLYRRALQDSLFNFTDETATLDTTLAKMSDTWDVKPQQGIPSKDQPLPLVTADSNSPTAAPDGPPSTTPINLLALIDPNKDVVTGKWELHNGKLLSPAQTSEQQIELPYLVPAEYDFRLVFRFTGGQHDIDIVASTPDTHFSWHYGKHNQTCAFSEVDGFGLFDPQNPTLLKSGSLAHNTSYTLLLKVRKTSVEASIDGKLISRLDTTAHKLSASHYDALHHPGTLGVGTADCDITIESADVTEITGHGKALR